MVPPDRAPRLPARRTQGVHRTVKTHLTPRFYTPISSLAAMDLSGPNERGALRAICERFRKRLQPHHVVRNAECRWRRDSSNPATARCFVESGAGATSNSPFLLYKNSPPHQEQLHLLAEFALRPWPAMKAPRGYSSTKSDGCSVCSSDVGFLTAISVTFFSRIHLLRTYSLRSRLLALIASIGNLQQHQRAKIFRSFNFRETGSGRNPHGDVFDALMKPQTRRGLQARLWCRFFLWRGRHHVCARTCPQGVLRGSLELPQLRQDGDRETTQTPFPTGAKGGFFFSTLVPQCRHQVYERLSGSSQHKRPERGSVGASPVRLRKLPFWRPMPWDGKLFVDGSIARRLQLRCVTKFRVKGFHQRPTNTFHPTNPLGCFLPWPWFARSLRPGWHFSSPL